MAVTTPMERFRPKKTVAETHLAAQIEAGSEESRGDRADATSTLRLASRAHRPTLAPGAPPLAIEIRASPFTRRVA
jgi:hypothetical protein